MAFQSVSGLLAASEEQPLWQAVMEDDCQDRGADSADWTLVNRVHPGDLVVTQDYGLAALCLARGAAAIDQNGRIYDENNIDSLLGMRHISKKVRRAGGRMKGPPKRTKEQDEWFERSLERLLSDGTPE